MKILIIRFSSIGDIVLTTPVIRCLKNQVPDAEIHFLLKKNYAEVLEHNPYIKKLHFLEANFSQVLSLLRKEQFDYVIDLQKNFRSTKLKYLLRVKHFAFNKLNFKKWFLVNFKIDLLPRISIVDRYMEATKKLSVANDGLGLDYFISQKDENIVSALPDSHKKNYIAWVIGAKHFTKRLPFEKMLSISRKISSPVVLLGGKEDFETGEKISGSDPAKFFNACGKFSLNESAALIKQSRLVVTHDTGLMHIAAAFKKRIVSIWGNTVPEFGMFPYYGDKNTVEENIILEVNGLSCRPCSKIGFEKCPRGHFKCMKEIDESAFVNL